MQHEKAQRGEIDEDAVQPVMAVPWVQRESSISLTKILFAANTLVFVVMVANALMNTGSPEFTSADLQWGANFGPYTLSGQWWRLVTYMFMHGGFFHIAMNMWCLWNLGTLSEALYGRWTFAVIYMTTGIAGGLASIAWNPEVVSVGASGALFGLTGALIASFYLGEFSLSGISIKATLSSLLFFAGFSLFLGVMPGTNIDNGAHVGGLVSGLIFGALIALVAPAHDQPVRRASVVLFVVMLVAASALGVQRWRGSQFGYRLLADRQASADRMIRDLQKKIAQNPQDASAHYALAGEYLAKGQFGDGEAELKRVLEIQPQNTRARMTLGATYLNQDQPKQAEEEFAKLVLQVPTSAGGHAGLAMALANQQRHAAAIDEYKIALRLEPQATEIYYKMGVSQAQLKRYDDAIASYLKERELNGDDPDLEIALGEAYEAKGMTTQAQEARDKAAQLRAGPPN